MTEKETEYSIYDTVRLLGNRKGVIWASVFVLTFLFFFYWLAAYPLYEARGLIQIAQSPVRMTTVAELLTFPGSSSPVNSQVEIIRSRSISEAVIDANGLNIQVRDITNGGPLLRPFFFAIRDRFKRDLRGIQLSHASFSPESVDRRFRLVFADESGGFRVYGRRGELGQGRLGEPFASEEISFTVTSMKGPAGSKFLLIPRSNHDTMLAYRRNLKVLTAGAGTNTDLIQVSFTSVDPRLSADVVNAVISEYEKRDREWKLSQGGAQSKEIDAQLERVLNELQSAEQNLEAYQSEHGVVGLPEEATVAVTNLAQREAQLADIDIRLSYLQNIHSTLEANLHGEEFALPPSLIQEPVLQQLATEHARLVIELNDLLIDYTENHPLVIAKREEIVRLRENILAVIGSMVDGLARQRSSLQSVISQLDQQLLSFPGVERQLLEMTRARDVADELFRMLIKRKGEAQLLEAATLVGNRVVDEAVPPDRHISPRLGVSLGLGVALGFLLGLILAFLVDVFDPRIRTLFDVQRIVPGVTVCEARRLSTSEISTAASTLALATMRAEKGMITLAKPGPDTGGVRELVEEIAARLASSLQPLLLIDATPSRTETSFFRTSAEPGLSDLAAGGELSLQEVEKTGVLVLPPGRVPSSGHVSSPLVREAVLSAASNAAFALVYAPQQLREPAMTGWNSVSGAAVLLLHRNSDSRHELASLAQVLKSENIPILAILLLG